jgi:hypothetical protein
VAEPLIEIYLGQLRAAAWPLPASRRDELVADVRSHIDAALEAQGTRDEAAIRTVLDRLGEPEAIAEAEVGESGATGLGLAAPSSRDQGAPLAGGIEIVALLLFAFGGIVPFIGVATAYALTFLSPRWTRSDRLYASAFLLGAMVVVLIASVRESLADPDTVIYTSPLTMAMVALPVGGWLAGIILIAALLEHRRRPAA